MNHIYRLVWNRTLRLLQVVSELSCASRGSDVLGSVPARAPRRGSLAIACALALGTASLLPLSAWAATGASNGGNGGAGGGAAAGNGGMGNGGGAQGGNTQGNSGVQGSPGIGGAGGAGGQSNNGIAGGTGGNVGAISVSGGNGGNGHSDPGASFSSGGGGGGGDGVYTSDTQFDLGNGLSITGGNGGNGGGGDRIGGGGGGGGAGLVLSQTANLTNNGIITGGNGGSGAAGQWSGGGGGGGDGVLVLGNASVISNVGNIVGGNGGNSGGPADLPGRNGDAGAGIDLVGDSDSVTNSGSIAGGGNSGGTAGAGILAGNGATITNQVGGTVDGGNNSGISSTGGTGIVVAAGSLQTRIDNAGTINGGIGGFATGGNNNNGAGGTAIAAAGNVLVNNSGVIQGGTGGSGGGGGTGGAGVVANASAADGQQVSITNLTGGVIEGGYGGALGSGNFGGVGINASGNVTVTNQAGASILGDVGGLDDISTTGATAIIAGNGVVIDNSGTVAGTGGGGDGLAAGSAIVASQSTIINRAGGLIEGGNGQGTLPGAGINAGGGVSIDNSGSIVGGHSDSSGTQGDAIDLSGGGNTLLLRAGSSITGNVVSTSGTVAGGDTLVLGGDVDAGGGNMFDAGTALGFAVYQKSGASTWTLAGNGSASQNWSIAAGTLVGNSHSIVGNVGDDAALVFDQADDGAYAGQISGSGSVTKRGAGALTLSGSSTYTGGTTLAAGTLNISSDANLGDVAGALGMTGATLQAGASFASGRAISVTGDNTIDTQGFSLTLNGPISAGANNASFNIVDKTGAGTLTLTGANTYFSATDVSAGTLALAGTGSIGTGKLDVAAGATFDISGTTAGATVTTLGGAGNIALGSQALTISLGASNSFFDGVMADDGIDGGSGGRLVIAGSQSVVFLSNVNTFTGGTTIAAGTLSLTGSGQLDVGGAVTANGEGVFDISAIDAGGTHIGDLSGDGGVSLGAKSLTLGGADDTDFSGSIDGIGGSLIKTGSGALVLDGVSSYDSGTEIQSGALIVGGDGAHAAASIAGDVLVDAGAALGGHGTVGGNVDVQTDGHLAPGHSIGTLTVGGNLTLSQNSQLDFEFGAPGADAHTFGSGDSVHVAGDLSIDGAVLNISDAGGFGPGLYNLFTYGGTLNESDDIVFGTTPGGLYTLQNLTAQKQINLINASDFTLDFWNANGLASATQMGGGDGTWSATSPNWTDATGSVTAAMQPQPGFAIFGGAAGHVTVDGSAGAVSVTGLQFARSGYVLDGDTLTLVGSNGAAPVIHVGDGSSASAGMTATIDNVIAGAAGLDKVDAGTLVLSGINTYSGGTTIGGGTLSVSNDANLGAASGALNLDGGVLRVTGTAFTATARALSMSANGGGFDIADAGNTFTVMQALGGSGSLSKSGDGTLVLSGANTYTGGTSITAGTLRGDTNSLQGDIADNGALAFDQSADGSYAGGLSGNGELVKTGAGNLVLGGDSHAFAGTAALHGGGLSIDGALGGALTTDAGTRLSGTGSVGSLDLGGTLALGHSIGTLSVDGDALIRSSASYEVETDAAGHSDLLAVGGKATLQGGSVLNLAQGNDYSAHTTYTILTAADGVDGQFASVTSTLVFVAPTLQYLPNAVQLTLTRNNTDFCDVAITVNQCAAGRAVQDEGKGPLYDALLTQDAGTARAAMGQWSGESLASTRSALLEDSRFVREAMNDRLHRADTAQDDARAIGSSAGSVWLHGWDHSGHADGDGNASTLQSSGSGLLLGVDAPMDDHLRAGLTGGQGQDSVQLDALHSSATVKSRHLGLYAGGNWGGWMLDAGAAQSWHDIHSTRQVDAVLPGTLRADYHGRTRQAWLEGGYRIDTARGSLQPFVNLAHVAVHTGNVNEYGSVAALASAGETTETSFGTVGVHGRWQLSDTALPASLYGTLGWRHAVGDLVPLAQQRFADSERFTVSGVPLAANAGVVQAGIDVALSGNASLRAGYDGVLSGRESDHAVKLTLGVTF